MPYVNVKDVNGDTLYARATNRNHDNMYDVIIAARSGKSSAVVGLKTDDVERLYALLGKVLSK